jgi:putative hydrolase of the HAD superfamily
MWGACMVETLDEHEPGHAFTLEAVRPLLSDGFPWHAPLTPHPELCERDAWWRHVGGLLATVYEGLGLSRDRGEQLALLACTRYVDPRIGWTVFDDTVPALERLRAKGWRHVVLSNHVPELAQIVGALGLAEWFDAVLTSAATGYEKPHPEMFALGLQAAGAHSRAWMIGDNYDADVVGAESAGIPAILVRREDDRAPRRAATLDELDHFLV